MRRSSTRRGQTQKDVVVGQAVPDNARYGHPIKNRVSLSRLFASPLAGEDARRAGEGYKNKVILNLIQDLRRTLLLFMNDMRGRFQIKFGMTSLFNKGFTLIELLVAIMIIGILAAVAVPQYQKAVMKSRFAAMMPIAKTLANANEVYYAEHDEYSTDPAKLNVTPQAGTPDGTAINMYSNPEEVSFVRVENPGVPNARYVVYQKLSENFPETTWCEAGDTRTEELCVALGGTLPAGLTGNSSGDNTNYKAYLLTGQARAGDSFAETGTETEPEPETPTCEGEAPTKQEACSSGCGSVTVTAECEEGEWVYPTADMSSCPVKPNDETVACDTGFTGNKTRTATCNSAGTAWEFTDNWNTSGCTAVPTCPAAEEPTQAELTQMQTTARTNSGNNNLTVSAQCGSDGHWKFVWTGGKTYADYGQFCDGSSAYACADGIFSGQQSICVATVTNGCAGSTFSGWKSNYEGYAANGCAGSTFSGDMSYCYGETVNACAGIEIQAGASCIPGTTGSCNGAKYGAHPAKDPNLIGSCNDESGYCPTGVPVQGNWNDTTHSYDISGWKGNCCNPAYMVSGVCPSGIAECSN